MSSVGSDSGAQSGGSFGGGGGGGGRRSRFGRFGARRRVVEPEEPLDYKNVAYLSRFVTSVGKIVSRRKTGFSGQDQRKLATAIKNARIVGLMPFVGRG